MSHEHDDIDTNNSTIPPSIRFWRNASRAATCSAEQAALQRLRSSAPPQRERRWRTGRDGDSGYGGYPQRTLKLNFDPVAKSLEDVVTVPPRLQRRCAVRARRSDRQTASRTTTTTAPTTRRASRCAPATITTACHYFGLRQATGDTTTDASDRGLLCMNHEAITPRLPASDRPDHRRWRAHGRRRSAARVLRARRQRHRDRAREEAQARKLERCISQTPPTGSPQWTGTTSRARASTAASTR